MKRLVALSLVAALAGSCAARGLRGQPRMRHALEELEAAAASLSVADADKGGHRVRALEFTRAAIAEVNAGIQYDVEH
jgi:hypothetical protein